MGHGPGSRAHASWPHSHISDALFERLSTKSFIQAGASPPLLSPRTRALVFAQWLFNPMKHLRLSPEEGSSATTTGIQKKGKSLARLDFPVPSFHVEIFASFFAFFRPPILSSTTARRFSRLCHRIRALD